MTPSANANNQITSGGATYDAAGDMTSDGTHTYSFDEMNRLSAFGTYLYTYGVKDNKRLVVYQNATPSAPSATINLYGPDGKRLGAYVYSGSNASWGLATLQNQMNYLYLGNKPLNYADDRVGSNRNAGGYFPFGQGYSATNPGAEGQTFGTYVQDTGTGLAYADQRYYDQSWGRFLTADPSNANVDYSNPISWNRYAYTNGDPVNSNDPTGLGLWDNGIVCWGGGADGQSLPIDGEFGDGITTLVGAAAQNYLNSVAASTGSTATTVGSDFSITFPSPQSAYGTDTETQTPDSTLIPTDAQNAVIFNIVPPTGPQVSALTGSLPSAPTYWTPSGLACAPLIADGSSDLYYLQPSVQARPPSDSSDGGGGVDAVWQNTSQGWRNTGSGGYNTLGGLSTLVGAMTDVTSCNALSVVP